MSTWTDKMHARAREVAELYYPDSLHKAFLFHALEEIERQNALIDGGDAQVERATAGFYEHFGSGVDPSIAPSWAKLVEVSPDIAQRYRDAMRAALAAAHHPEAVAGDPVVPEIIIEWPDDDTHLRSRQLRDSDDAAGEGYVWAWIDGSWRFRSKASKRWVLNDGVPTDGPWTVVPRDQELPVPKRGES